MELEGHPIGGDPNKKHQQQSYHRMTTNVAAAVAATLPPAAQHDGIAIATDSLNRTYDTVEDDDVINVGDYGNDVNRYVYADDNEDDDNFCSAACSPFFERHHPIP